MISGALQLRIKPEGFVNHKKQNDSAFIYDNIKSVSEFELFVNSLGEVNKLSSISQVQEEGSRETVQ